MADIQQRKAQHLQLAMEEESQGRNSYWEKYQLPIKALPELDLKDVDTSTEFLGKRLKQPLIIASMTGGSAHAMQINTNLAIAAEECGVALGVGSQRAALEKPDMAETFKVVRKYAPKTAIIANMGAVQLNYGRTIEDYKRVADMVEADGLYLHLNAMQEALQPEGDTDFSNLKFKILNLKKALDIPILIKEVGSGIDEQTAKDLIEMGVYAIDVAGVGGTSWTWIEGKRSGNDRLTEWFSDWGIDTSKSIVRVSVSGARTQVIASGGIRNPIQAMKAHLLGADYYSAARPFLETAMASAEETTKLIQDWEKGTKLCLFGMGCRNWEEAGKLEAKTA